jgi:hypothetical protein
MRAVRLSGQVRWNPPEPGGDWRAPGARSRSPRRSPWPCSSRSVRDRAGTLALVGLWKIDYEAAQRRHERLEPARLFFGRVLDRIFILTCWYLLAVMVGVFGFWALLGVARLF